MIFDTFKSMRLLTAYFTYAYYVAAALAIVGMLFTFTINRSIEKLQVN